MCGCRKFVFPPDAVKNVIRRNASFANKSLCHSFTRRLSTRIYGWGSNDAGELGKKWKLGDQPTPLCLENDGEVDNASCGYGTTFLFKKSSPKIECFGLNSCGQLGTENEVTENNKIGQILKLASGRAHTLLLSTEGVFSAGSNIQGQCGNPQDVKLSKQFQKVTSPIDSSCIRQIACGLDHSLILDEDGKIYSTGLGADGQIGLGIYDCQYGFSKVIGEINDKRITYISTTTDTCIALSEEGELFGWGNNEQGQISSTSQEKQIAVPTLMHETQVLRNVTRVLAGGSFSAVLSDGAVYIKGYGALGLGPEDIKIDNYEKVIVDPIFGKIKDIAGGPDYLAALTDSGVLLTWGRGNHGRLGHGDNEDQYEPKRVKLPGRVIKFSCGIDHMIAVTECKDGRTPDASQFTDGNKNLLVKQNKKRFREKIAQFQRRENQRREGLRIGLLNT